MADYWGKRFEKLNKSQFNKGEDFIKELERHYKIAEINIQKEINHWYTRLANNNGVSIEEAKKILNDDELEEFRWSVQDYIEKGKENAINQQWMKELENASAKVHITRLESLSVHMQQHINAVMDKEDKGLKSVLTDVYTDGYYKTAYEIEKGLGIGKNLSALNTDMVEMLVSKPWARDGSNFSERIWGNHRKELINILEEDLVSAIRINKSERELITKLSKIVSDDIKDGKKAAETLVRSETAFFNSAATKDSYLELDTEEFEVLATLELGKGRRTCDECAEKDSKHYPMSKYEIGKTAPPFHPNCRCTTVPYFDDEFTKNETRTAKFDNGKTKHIKDMSFEEWKKNYINDVGGEENYSKIVKANKNLKTDRKQYKQYKAVLGKNAPKNLEEFQEIKYNDSDQWKTLKLSYNDKNLQNEIRESYNLNILEGKQGKHILNHNNYIDSRSYLTISIGEAQKLVNKYAGTGRIDRDREGKWKHTEVINTDKVIGIAVDNRTGEKTITKTFKVHYSKNGVHIVPKKE